MLPTKIYCSHTYHACTYHIVLFSLLSLVLMGATQPFVMVSSMLGLVVAPTAAMQQQKLTQVVALDQTNDRMESEVELLEAENARLTAQVQEMEKTVSQ